MQIRTRFSISADGYVTTPDGWPALVADPAYEGGKSHGFPEFQQTLDAVLMGRTTFEPAIAAERWPWPLTVTIGLVDRGGDVHLVGGARTIETFRALGALDKLGLLVLPIFLGAGLRMTPAVSVETELTLESVQPLPGGSVEIVYYCR